MPSLHLFVDTNVFLSFYAFASDDIEQLKKLEGLIESGKLKLYVPMQVADEFWRNRETKLAKSIDDFAVKGSTALPRFMIGTAEADVYRDAMAEVEKARNALVQKAREDAAATSLAVDSLVTGLMEKAGIGAITSGMIENARLRRDLGNPPGKQTTLGDQINWEYLLETVEEEVTLHVVSIDGDYKSALKNGRPHQFLIDEWRQKKKSELCLHKELKPFLNAQFKIIKLEVDAEKTAAVEKLSSSGSFAMTHSAIATIEPFFDALTVDDANKLIGAGIENSQINWISDDSDVQNFYTHLLEKFAGQLEFGFEAVATGLFKKNALEPADEDDNIPFA